MNWKKFVNVTNTSAGSFRSVAGYATESLVIGRALLCGYNIFFKAWRDSKYDAVLDANGLLHRIEIKGTSGEKGFSTTSGGRTGEQINRNVASREQPLSIVDCDWLIASSNLDGTCWIIPVEFIEILGIKSLSKKDINVFEEKWKIFLHKDRLIKDNLVSGFRKLKMTELNVIAKKLKINIKLLSLQFKLYPQAKRIFILSKKERLIIEIWLTIFKAIK